MSEQPLPLPEIPGSYLANRKVAAIINRKAGTAALRLAESGEAKLFQAFREAGIDAQIHVVEPVYLADAMLEIVHSGAEVVLVGGGDGSINTAARYLHNTSKVLGVLPLGTHNHFAQSLGVPFAIGDALRALDRGVPQAVDLGEVNGRIFVNSAGIGIYPEAVRKREQYREKLRVRKLTAMGYALFALLWDLPVLELQMERDGLQEHINTSFLFIGNNRYKPKLLSYPVRLSLSEGCLGIFFAHNMSAPGLIRIALRILLGQSREYLELHRIEAVEVVIKSRLKKMKVALDGELHRIATPLRVRILPQSLNVLYPR